MSDDVVSTQEALRLLASGTGTNIRHARWENVYTMWEAGKSMAAIGIWIGVSESTVRRLLRRAALERQKKPGYVWPLDNGRKVCDIPHPMPKGDDPRLWHHARAKRIVSGRRRLFRLRHGAKLPDSRQFFCPVCRVGYLRVAA